MTEAAFWGWIRSGLRTMSVRWRPRGEALKLARVPYVGDNRRRKWSYRCALCYETYPAKQVEVDHIEPCGSLRGAMDLPGFVNRMFCEVEGLRVLCRGCHKAIKCRSCHKAIKEGR